jgi:hypothetical protein
MSDEQKHIVLTREQILQRALKPIIMQAQPYGRLKLEAFTAHCSELLVELLDQELPAREFTVHAVHAMLLSPQLSLDAVRMMPDRL